jgi:hypothetical protein
MIVQNERLTMVTNIVKRAQKPTTLFIIVRGAYQSITNSAGDWSNRWSAWRTTGNNVRHMRRWPSSSHGRSHSTGLGGWHCVWWGWRCCKQTRLHRVEGDSSARPVAVAGEWSRVMSLDRFARFERPKGNPIVIVAVNRIGTETAISFQYQAKGPVVYPTHESIAVSS